MFAKPIKNTVFISIIILSLQSFAQVTVGSGSYATSFPGVDAANRNSFPSGVPQLSGIVANKPVPTNDWWSKLIKENHADNLFNYPMTMKTINQGLVTTYIPWGVIDDQQPIIVGVQGLNENSVSVSDFSDWTVTMNWGDKFKATSGIGMPFLYFEKGNSEIASITINLGTVVVSGEMITVTDARNGGDFAIYAPTGSTWTKTGNVYTSTLNGKNYWSLAMLPQTTTNVSAVANQYKKYAYVFPTNTIANWSFNESTSRVTTVFSVSTDVKEGSETTILQGLLPHQWANLASGSAQPTLTSYQNVRGEIKILDGNTFTVENTFKGILPTLPNLPHYSNTFEPNELNSKITLLENEGLATWTDSYNEGQVMNRLIQTARLADQTGNIVARDKMIATIKERLEDWLTYQGGEVAFLFYYNTNWKTMLGYPAGHGQDSNINDHHFHWGYFIHAAAFLEQFEPGWANQWGEMVNLLVRDAASPDRNDTMFPFLRNFSPYAGHSWANGFATFPQGNDQESTSESMQFASALIHWGTITENDEIRDLGIYIYTTEQTAIEEYWFDMYNRNFQQNQQYSLVSRVWGNSYDNGTFWTADITASYVIELYPMHGGSLYLGHNTDYVQTIWNELKQYTEISNPNSTNPNLWYDTIWKYLSFLNPDEAITLYNASPNRTLKFGISDAQTYHWLHTMKALGKIDATVTANYPVAAVFNDNGTKTYVAHNYSDNEIVVTFSDGFQLTVPANEMKTSRDIAVSGTLTADKTEVNQNETVNLSLATTGSGITKVEFYKNNDLLGEVTSAPFNYAATNLPFGIYGMYAKIYTNSGSTISNIVNVQVGSQKPYGDVAQAIPGIIEAAHYDYFEGGVGQNISYYDSSVINEGDFRTNEYVDAITITNEGATVGWISGGEWLEYTVDVQTAGCYNVNLRYASGNTSGGGPIYFEVDGTKVSEDITFATTENWNTWQTKTVTLDLAQGTQILKLKADNGEVNLGKMTFAYNGTTCPVAQEMVLPFDFETSPTTTDFNNFDGGTATVVNVTAPQSTGNSSSKMAKILRNGGQPWSGSYINLTSPLNFTNNKYISLKVWTDAPIGTSMQIKLERQNAGGAFELATPTKTSGQWETIYWDFSQLGASTYDKLIFMFDIGKIGDGTDTSTFYFDDVVQTNVLSSETFTSDDLVIYPNPINTKLFILSKTREINKIEIFSLIGKKIREYKKDLNAINVEGLSSGLYLIKIYSEKSSFTTKIIKQ